MPGPPGPPSMPGLPGPKPVRAKKEKPKTFELLHLSAVVLCDDWDTKHTKQVLSELKGAPAADRMRIRDKLSDNLGNVWKDDKTVGKNAPGSRDGKEIVLIQTHTEEFFTAKHILLCIHQWLPQEQQLAEPKEIAFHKSDTIASFKTSLGEMNDIPADEVRVVKARAFQLKDLSMVPKMDWFGLELSDESKIGSSPWKCRDGDIVLFKDNRQKEVRKKAAPIKRVPAKPSNNDQGGGIRFFTLEEMKERKAQEEELKKIKAAERAKEEEAARQRRLKKREDMTEEEKMIEDAIAAERIAKEAELEEARQDAIDRANMARQMRGKNPMFG